MAAKDYIHYKHPLHEKWRGVYHSMVVHTQDAEPVKLFRERRPLESSNLYALQYRLDNHRNVVKSAFDLAIDQYIEAANNIDATVKIGAVTEEYLSTFRLFDGYKGITLKDWVFQFVGRYKQTDPNSFVVVLPMHPTEDLIPTYEAEIPMMETAANMRPRPTTWLVPFNDVTYVDDYTFTFKAGAWTINPKGITEPYYFSLTKDQITLIYPTETKQNGGKKSVEYVEVPWYNVGGYESYTAFVTGGKSIVWSDAQGEIYQYYISDFYGAAQIADILVGNMSDLQIIESRFTYPEKWARKKECNAVGCMLDHSDGMYKVGGKVCGTCAGTGYIQDTSPLGTHQLDDKEDYAESGNPKLPVGYVTPDTAILKHKADRTEAYYHWMMRELGLNVSQNMTNASGESKRYDMMQKVTLISSIVVDIYRLYENVLNAFAWYLGDTEKVVITLPKDFDIKNADDISDELKAAKEANLPYAVLTELTKRYMLSKFGNNEKNRKKVEYLALKDKLFVYGIEDLRNAIAIHGTDITNTDKVSHIMGWQVLDEILREDPEISMEELDRQFMERIAVYIPAAAATATTII
jgi:hypothetical protein